MSLRLTLILVAAATLAACSTAPSPSANLTSSTPAPGGPAGTYRLESIDGHALPHRPIDPDRPPEAGPGPLITRGSLALDPAGTFNYAIVFQSRQSAAKREMKMNGTWRAEGDAFRLVWPNGAVTPGKFDGQTFTINNLGMEMTFRRNL